MTEQVRSFESTPSVFTTLKDTFFGRRPIRDAKPETQYLVFEPASDITSYELAQLIATFLIEVSDDYAAPLLNKQSYLRRHFRHRSGS